MARIARIVAPDIPHHITQRGNRNQPVFFSDDDRLAYLQLIRDRSSAHQVQIWAYCLMDNHVHLIAVPKSKDGLVRCFREVHYAYSRRINFREGWRGYLWQGRFASFPMSERYLVAAMRYVECNPVRANIVKRAEDYRWSSARAHVYGGGDSIIHPCYLMKEITNWSAYLGEDKSALDRSIEGTIRTGRPLGPTEFVEKLERMLGREIKKKRPGPKRREHHSIK